MGVSGEPDEVIIAEPDDNDVFPGEPARDRPGRVPAEPVTAPEREPVKVP